MAGHIEESVLKDENDWMKQCVGNKS